MLIDDVLKTLYDIDSELFESDIYNYHYRIDYNNINNSIDIIVYDDDNDISDLYHRFNDVSNKDFIIFMMMYINNYDTNIKYSKYAKILRNTVFDTISSIII